MKKTLLLLSLIGSLGSAQAAVQITQNAAAPTENLIAYAEGYNDATLNWNAYGTTTSTYRDVGQSFVAPTDSGLSAISYFIDSFESQAAGASFTIKIFETESPTTLLQDGTLVSTQYGVLPQDLFAKEYITFGLEQEVQLTAGMTYTVMLHFDEKGTSNSAGSRRLVKFAIGAVSGTNPLGANTGFWLSSDFTNYYKDSKIMTAYFQTAAVPEPATTALIVGAGMVLLAKAKSRSLLSAMRSRKR